MIWKWNETTIALTSLGGILAVYLISQGGGRNSQLVSEGPVLKDASTKVIMRRTKSLYNDSHLDPRYSESNAKGVRRKTKTKTKTKKSTK